MARATEGALAQGQVTRISPAVFSSHALQPSDVIAGHVHAAGVHAPKKAHLLVRALMSAMQNWVSGLHIRVAQRKYPDPAHVVAGLSETSSPACAAAQRPSKTLPLHAHTGSDFAQSVGNGTHVPGAGPAHW